MSKTEMLSFRVSQEENKEIKARLDEIKRKRSTVFREAIFAYLNSDKPELSRKQLEEFSAMKKQFRNTGNNLNQIAYYLNSGHPITTPQLQKSHDELKAFFHQLADFFERIEDELR